MYWKDEGFLLYKNNFNENSIIVEAFTLKHGKCTGIVYGGASKKRKRIFQIGNKILINCNSKNSNRTGYFNIELIKPISPFFFDDKKKSICLLSASSILKILLPERQLNGKIYDSFEKFLDLLKKDDWIKSYIEWELFLVKELGFEVNLPSKENVKSGNFNVSINNKDFRIPKLLINDQSTNFSKKDILEALIFNKTLLHENFIFPNGIKFPLSRNILERYFN